VEVLFASAKLQRQLSTLQQLQRKWGQQGGNKIALRLQQLAAAPTLADMRQLPGRCHELTGDRAGMLAVDVEQPYRLVFRPTANPSPTKEDGGLDWDAVESVTIAEVVDYH
jgi:proteic killer suppression protein